MLSTAALVMLGVKGGEGSVRGFILLCVLSIYPSVRCTFSRLNCSLGEGIVLLFVVRASCVSGALV